MKNDELKLKREIDNFKKDEFIKDEKRKASYQTAKESKRRRKVLEDISLSDISKRLYDIESYKKVADWRKEDKEKNIPFIDCSFSKYTPLASGQWYLFGAAQKQGKTTFATNCANSVVNSGGKVLYITNEESEEDVRGRDASLELGLSYVSFIDAKTTEEQNSKLEALIVKRSENLHVVSRDHADTLDADIMVKILKGSLGEDYDSIIIDYVSKVSKRSLVNITEAWQAQEYLYYEIDALIKSKDKCPPIITFAQFRRDKTGKMSLKQRLEGRKTLLNLVTGTYEIIKDRDNGRTIVEIHNSRWYRGVDLWFFDFDNGKLKSNNHQKKLLESIVGGEK